MLALFLYIKVASGFGAPSDCCQQTTIERNQYWFDYMVQIGEGVTSEEATLIVEANRLDLFESSFSTIQIPTHYVGDASRMDEFK
jgi:hypothetical protein